MPELTTEFATIDAILGGDANYERALDLQLQHILDQRELANGYRYKRGAECAECGSREDLTCDHVQPLSCAGWHAPDNCQTLCRSCNSSKRNRVPFNPEAVDHFLFCFFMCSMGVRHWSGHPEKFEKAVLRWRHWRVANGIESAWFGEPEKKWWDAA
jgi:hypothetical protein